MKNYSVTITLNETELKAYFYICAAAKMRITERQDKGITLENDALYLAIADRMWNARFKGEPNIN